MRKILLSLLFLPNLVLAATKVLVISDFSAPMPTTYTSDEALPLFFRLQRAVKPFYIELEESSSFPKETKELDCLIFWNYPAFTKKWDFSRLPAKKMILFTWEPPTVQKRLHHPKFHAHFAKVYTWNDELVDGKKYFKFFYPVMHPMRELLPSFEERKLCTQIISKKTSKHPSELYTEREKVIRYFEGQPNVEFEFYGHGWNHADHYSYKGAAPQDKVETLKHYRTAICYENIRDLPGYITEKIFDCFEAGTIPIYLGASNVEDYIPKGCFIDRRDFTSEADLLAFLKKLTKKDYETYLKNIQMFLSSEQAEKFSFEYFKKTISNAISGK